MVISGHASSKFRWMSLVAILCVILGHSVPGEGPLQRTVLALFAQWHVPWFLFLSGMMLAYSLGRDSAVRLLVKKARTLVVPFIFWCVLCLVLRSGCLEASWNPLDVFGITTVYPAGNGHLWYLRSLIVLTFSTLSLSVLARWTGRFSFACTVFLSLLFFGFWIARGIDLVTGTPTTPLYFILGFSLAPLFLRERRPVFPGSPWSLFLLVLVLLVVARVAWFSFPLSPGMEKLVRIACVLLQISLMSLLIDCVPGRLKEPPRFLSPVFFVYCCHGVILAYVARLWRGGEGACPRMLATFFVVTASSFLLACGMRAFCPKTYGWLTGGR